MSSVDWAEPLPCGRCGVLVRQVGADVLDLRLRLHTPERCTLVVKR